jgi:hypothetical protein
MQKLKNKKRLTGTVIVFLLTFLVGAAFALTDGILDIEGRVRVAAPDLVVIWADDGGDFTGTRAPFPPFAEGSGTFVNTWAFVDPFPDVNGRPRQTIVWTIDFGTFGADDPDSSLINPFIDWSDFDDFSHYAILTAVAHNISDFDAEITNPTLVYDASLADELGLIINFVENSEDDFMGEILSGAVSEELIVGVIWDSTEMSADFDAADVPWLELEIAVSFDYIPIVTP